MSTILEEAGKLVDGDRAEAYGHPAEDFARTAKMWSAILGVEVSREQIALCMVALKISRQVNKPGRDNLVDACGYLRTIEKIEEFDRKQPGGVVRLPKGVRPEQVRTLEDGSYYYVNNDGRAVPLEELADESPDSSSRDG